MGEKDEIPAVSSVPPGWGCATTLGVFNISVIGIITVPLAIRGYASSEQALWYRYGSLAFLLVGALTPMAVLLAYGRRSPRAVVAVTMWMIVALLLWTGWLLNSGGGV